MALDVPVNPIYFGGPVDHSVKNRYTYDHAVHAQEVYAFTRINNTNIYLMSFPKPDEPLFYVSPPSNFDFDLNTIIPPEGTVFHPDGRLQYRADSQELRDYVVYINGLGGDYVVRGEACLSEFEGEGKYWGNDYPSSFALPSGGGVKKYRTYRAGADLLEPLPNIGATETMPACLLDVVGKGERRGSTGGTIWDCLGSKDEFNHFLLKQHASTFSFQTMNAFDISNEAHVAEVCSRQHAVCLTIFAIYGNNVEITQYGCGVPLALLKVKGCYEFLDCVGPYAFLQKLTGGSVDKMPHQITKRRIPQVEGEHGCVAFVLPTGVVPSVPGARMVRGWPTVVMPASISRAAAAAGLEKYGFVPKYSLEDGLLTENVLFVKTLSENQGLYPVYDGEVVQIFKHDFF
jgi:hypothetical protein